MEGNISDQIGRILGKRRGPGWLLLCPTCGRMWADARLTEQPLKTTSPTLPSCRTACGERTFRHLLGNCNVSATLTVVTCAVVSMSLVSLKRGSSRQVVGINRRFKVDGFAARICRHLRRFGPGWGPKHHAVSSVGRPGKSPESGRSGPNLLLNGASSCGFGRKVARSAAPPAAKTFWQ